MLRMVEKTISSWLCRLGCNKGKLKVTCRSRPSNDEKAVMRFNEDGKDVHEDIKVCYSDGRCSRVVVYREDEWSTTDINIFKSSQYIPDPCKIQVTHKGVKRIKLGDDSNRFVYWENHMLKVGPGSKNVKTMNYDFDYEVHKKNSQQFVTFKTKQKGNFYVTAQDSHFGPKLKLENNGGCPKFKDPRSFIINKKCNGNITLRSVTQNEYYWYAYLQDETLGLSKDDESPNAQFQLIDAESKDNETSLVFKHNKCMQWNKVREIVFNYKTM